MRCARRLAAAVAFVLLGAAAGAQAPASPSPKVRVVSLAPALTEMLFAVGAGGQVVGVTEYCNFPPEAARVTKVGGMTSRTISLERVAALAPDLVLAYGLDQEEAVAALRRLGLPVQVLKSETVADVLDHLSEVGALTGHASVAARVRADLEGRMARVREVLAAAAPPRPRVFYEVWDRPLMTAGRPSYINELITLGGGRNVFDDLAQGFVQVSEEAVLARDPEVILAPDQHLRPLNVESLLRRPVWRKMSAVEARRVHVLPGDLVSRPGPRLAAALETVAAAIHPGLFARAPAESPR
jgi:iron complex transport system substrate-binding protein